MIFRLLVVSLLSTSIVGLPLSDPKSKDDSPDCQNCKFVVSLVHDIWGDQTLDDCLGDLADFVCTVLQIEDHFVCKTITTGFRDEVLWILGQILVEPDEICSLLLPNCGVFFDPFDVTWSVDVPGDKPPVQPYPVPPSGKPTLRVLHLSDLHIDMEYQEGLEAKCSEPQCCRPQSDPQEISKDDVKEAAGHWGTVGNCDSPYYLVANMLQHIADTHKDLDYIVVSGDLESHADWVYTHESHAAMVRNISATITQFLPGIPAFFAVGNHEGVPIDNFAPRWSPPQFNISWLYDAMADSWASWVGVDAVTTVRYNACFMVKLYPGLRLISLNNGLGDSNNFWLYVNQTDPDGAMTWFRDQLLEAEKAGDKVHVVAHIPGGSGELLESWNMNYYNITNRFENTIMAHFFGHEHSEEFVIQFENPDDEKSRATAVVLSAPSVTTYSSYNPAYRIYTVDGVYAGSSYALIDFEDYYLDLKKANADPQNPKWETLFASARTEYGLNSMAPTEWSEMINRMKTDDDLFQRYRNNYFRHTDRATSSCDQGCRHGFLCDARRAHHTDKLCDDLQGAQVRSTRRAAKLAKKQSTRNSPSLIELQSRVENFKRNRDADTCPI